MMGLVGIVFGVLGIFFSGLIFIPLGLICTLFSFFQKGFFVTIVSLLTNIVAIIVSPSVWALILGLVGASQINGV